MSIMLAIRDWLRNASFEKTIYHSVQGDDFEGEDLEPLSPQFSRDKKYRSPLLPRLRYVLLCSAGAFMLFLIHAKIPNTSRKFQSHPGTSEPGYLRLLIPTITNPASAQLCQTIHSAAILGYSTPTLINWSYKPNHSTLSMRLIAGILTHLRTIRDEFSDDLVIIADEASFFQLRPEVLLSRFLEINDRANAQLEGKMGRVVKLEGIKQQVIFSAQRNCSSLRADYVECYGATTSLKLGTPGFLDTSMAIGTVAAMRNLFERAWEYILIAEDKAHKLSATTESEKEGEEPLSRIFGEQNIQREFLRLHHRSNFKRLRDTTGGFLSRNRETKDPINVLDASHPASTYLARYYPSAPFDFGIGLDYDNELWASDSSVIRRTFSDLTSSSTEETTTSLIGDTGTEDLQLQTNLPNDIAISMPPFYAPHIPHRNPHSPGSAHTNSPQSWSETPLLTHTQTSAIPAALISSSSNSTWQQSWLAPHIPSLLGIANARPRQAIASTTYRGVRREWWSLQSRDMRNGEVLGVMIDDSGDWKGLEEVCGRWVEEGKGKEQSEARGS